MISRETKLLEAIEQGTRLTALHLTSLSREVHLNIELLAALKGVLTWVDGWSPNFESDPEWLNDRDNINEIVRKAEAHAA